MVQVVFQFSDASFVVAPGRHWKLLERLFDDCAEPETVSNNVTETVVDTGVYATQHAVDLFTALLTCDDHESFERMGSVGVEVLAQVAALADYFAVECVLEAAVVSLRALTKFHDGPSTNLYGCAATLHEHSSTITALALLADGKLASGSSDSKIKLWDTTTGACTGTLYGQSGGVMALACLADGRLASGHANGCIVLWDVVVRSRGLSLAGHSGSVLALAALADGRLASGSSDRTVMVWGLSGSQARTTLSGHLGSVTCLAALHGGRIASGSWDMTVRLWDVRSAVCTGVLARHSDTVRCLHVLADGRLVSSSNDRTIKLWDVDTGACMGCTGRHPAAVDAISTSSDGHLIAGCVGHGIYIWNTDTMTCDNTVHRAQYVGSLAALPRNQIAHGSQNGQLALLRTLATAHARREMLQKMRVPYGLVERVTCEV